MKTDKFHYNGKVSAIISSNNNGERHGVSQWFGRNGKLWYEEINKNGKLHGLSRTFGLFGMVIRTKYWMYGDEVSKEEYKRFELIKQLSGLGE